MHVSHIILSLFVAFAYALPAQKGEQISKRDELDVTAVDSIPIIDEPIILGKRDDIIDDSYAVSQVIGDKLELNGKDSFSQIIPQKRQVDFFDDVIVAPISDVVEKRQINSLGFDETQPLPADDDYTQNVNEKRQWDDSMGSLVNDIPTDDFTPIVKSDDSSASVDDSSISFEQIAE